MTLLSTLNNCLNNYIENGKRSNTRVISLHQYIGSFLKNPEYEKTIQGLFNKKNVDIYEPSTNKVYEIKLILGNYKQNINNYIENMIGATINLKASNFDVCQMIFIPKYLPYFNKDGFLKRIEYISTKSIMTYKNIINSNLESKPSELVYQLFDTGNLSFLQENLNKKIILNDLKKSYNISLVESIDDTVNNFLYTHSFNKFIDKRK